MIQIKPMTEQYLHLTCMHDGPVDPSNQVSPDPAEARDWPDHPWDDDTLRAIADRYPGLSHGNGPVNPCAEFCREMIIRYGTCALLAWQDDAVIGHIRFFPMAIARLIAESQTDPSPLLDCTLACEPEYDDGALWVQCLMASPPYVSQEAAQEVGARQGVGSQLASALIDWAQLHGWKRIVKVAHCDLDWFYGVQGGGGKAFWEKVGFRVTSSFFMRAWEFESRAWAVVQKQIEERDMSVRDIWTWYRMQWDAPS